MLIRLRNIALILNLFFIPSIYSLGVIDLGYLSDSAENNVSCESDEQCLYAKINDVPRHNDTEEITDDVESDSDSSESLESKLKLLAPLLQNDGGTKITFNVRDIQNGFHNYGAGYHIGNIPDEAARVKRQIDSTVQISSNNVVQNNEQTFFNTSDNENNTTNTNGQVEIQNKTLPNNNVLFNNDSVIQEPNSSLVIETKTAKNITDNPLLTNVINSHDSLVTIASTISESGIEVNNMGDNALSANKSNGLENANISTSKQNENSDSNSLSFTTINKIQSMLSNFLNNVSSNLHTVYRHPLKNNIPNEDRNAPIVVYYTCNCGISKAHKQSEEDLDNISNTQHSTSTNINNNDGENSFRLPNTDISNKLAKLSAKGNKYISKKINDANLSYWKNLLSILSNTSSVELAVDNTNGLNIDTKPFLVAKSSNDTQINKNIQNSQINESADNTIANSYDGAAKQLQHNNITSNATQIDQGLTNIQTNVNNLDANQKSPQDQNIQSITSRKRRSIPRNLKHAIYQVKSNRKKRQAAGDLNEMIKDTYPFSHHAFHHLDRPFPHHAFHHLNRAPFPHHAFHHLNRPLYFSNHRKALRHLINTNFWLQTFGDDNTSTEDKPSGYNNTNKEVVEKRQAGKPRKEADADESESGIGDDDVNKSGDDVDSSTSLPKRFNFTVKVSLK